MGRAKAIEDVYERKGRVFRAALAGITGSFEAANDVVQESFARALASRRSYRGDGPLEAWIWAIAVRVALEYARLPIELPLEEAFEPALPEPRRDEELAQAVRELSPRRRLMVFLRYVADLSYREIAELCQVTEGTVAATLAQAHAELFAALASNQPDTQGTRTEVAE
jgi:RNA polymerase sigma-70 factor (ECF subfamily)